MQQGLTALLFFKKLLNYIRGFFVSVYLIILYTGMKYAGMKDIQKQNNKMLVVTNWNKLISKKNSL